MTALFLRRCALLGVICALAWNGAACKRKRPQPVAGADDSVPSGGPPVLASTVHMGDPKAVGQLAEGFHQIENGAWRWTERRFSVDLRPPPGASGKGVTLTLNLTIPQVSIDKLGAITLSAVAGGSSLQPETYSKPGEYVYRREVPPGVLSGDSARIDFTLDKAIPPGSTDLRELGVIVLKVSLEPK